MNATTWIYLGFFTTIALVIDLFFSGSKEENLIRDSVIWTIIWTSVALLFTFFINAKYGTKEGAEYLTSYILERFLSFDNIFIFVIIFNKFGIPKIAKKRALFWGIVLAVLFRGIFIVLGTEIIDKFHWILYIFAVFLIYSSFKLFIESIQTKDEQVEEDAKIDGYFSRLAKKILPFSDDFHGSKIFTRVNGKILLTPMFLIIGVIGVSDVVFALDSIPAVFGITRDPFIILTANIFSLLGLRATFFFIVELLKYVYYLNVALSFMLFFIGAKILLEFLSIHISPFASLSVVCGTLLLAVVASLIRKKILSAK